MKKQLLTSALLSLLCNILFAQAPSIEWQKCLGGSSDEAGFAVRQTIDGGYVTAGFSQSNDGDVSGNHGQQDYWVVRTDPGADITWQKSLGGNSIDQATSLDETTDGGFIVAGYSYSNNGDVTGNHGSSDVWVIKLDDAGTLLWQKALGGTSDDAANSIAQTTDDGFIVAGYSSSNDGDVSGNHGLWDYWVVKLDATGNLVWQKSLGGSNNDVAYAVKQSSDGGYIVTGYSESSDGDVSGNSGARDFWIVKLNEIGDLEWENYFGGSAYDESYAVAETAAGDFVASGFAGSNDGDVSGNHGGYDFWVVKIDAIGNMVAQACFGGGSTDQSFSMDETVDDGFVIGGQSFSNDGDVSGNHGGYDFWVGEAGCSFSTSNGKRVLVVPAMSMDLTVRNRLLREVMLLPAAVCLMTVMFPIITEVLFMEIAGKLN
jgi:hypothetical protein